MARPEDSDTKSGIRYTVWAMKVKERDNYTCMACRRNRDQVTVGAYRTGPEFVGDGRASDYELDNGGTFCKRCALNELRQNNLGGRKPGFAHSEDTKYKMSLALTGRPKSEEHRKKISEGMLAKRK